MTYPFKLSVLISTYNHEKFIAEAIESVLDQKVPCDYEIVISDDCSTDQTRKIIQHYLKQVPSRMRLLPAEKNLGITKNLQKGLSACKGEYIAILEGDDYWISPYKLQKQIDFLDQYRDCSLCFNGLLILTEKQVYQEHGISPCRQQSSFFVIEDLIRDNFIGNFSTCMYRHEVIKELPVQIYHIFTVDWMFNMACAQFGRIGYIPLQMTAYRQHGHGVWSSQNPEAQYKQILGLIGEYDKTLNYKYTRIFTETRQLFQQRLEALKNSTLPHRRWHAFIKDFLPPIFIRGIKKLIKK